MSPLKSSLVSEVLRSEGPLAVRDRILDRLREFSRRRGLRPLTRVDGRLQMDAPPPPVVNFSPLPPSPKRGGSHIQMLDRLDVERDLRTVALVYPRGEDWWIEVWNGRRSGLFHIGRNMGAADAATTAAHLVGTDAVHFENLFSLPMDLVSAIESRDFRSVLSLHDFSLWCSRPHLIESGTGKFCHYSSDDHRCAECLGHRSNGSPPVLGQAKHRGLSARSIEAARIVVFPSGFLQLRHRELFPLRRPDQKELVIAPASARRVPKNSKPADRKRFAFVGGVYDHKGGALIGSVMTALESQLPGARGFVYGTGDASILRRIKGIARLRIRGYYRQGSLPTLLRRDRISVAILPSIWPETYSIVVDECLAAGVPVVAFNLGAPADRLREWKAGGLVSIEEGPEGLAAAAAETSRHPIEVSAATRSLIPNPALAAQEHIRMHTLLNPVDTDG